MHSVQVHQLTSKTGTAYLNVIDEEHGKIEVWACLEDVHPTYLIQDKFRFYLIVFDNQNFADEWLDKFEGAYEKIQRINSLV